MNRWHQTLIHLQPVHFSLKNVMETYSNYLESLPAASYRLTRNLRNTRAIFNEASQYYRGIKIRAVGPQGLPVVRHQIENSQHLKDLRQKRTSSRASYYLQNALATYSQVHLSDTEAPHSKAVLQTS